MSSSEPPQSVSNPSPSSPSSPIAGPSSTASTSAAAAAAAPRPPPPPLTGFRASLEHTGIPRSVLLWKPRLPSRNWSIFLSIVGSVTYAYYYDRKQCRKIRQEYIDKVKGKALEPMQGSLDVPRKVRVIAARWPEDDDENRGWLYFRKYLKPYLVAAAVDYEQLPAPLQGSIARQIHAAIVHRRRQALGLEPKPTPVDMPGVPLPDILNPEGLAQRELEGGTVLIGRASLKEYMEGLRRGWMGGVDQWEWEKDVEEKLKGDGVFETLPTGSPDDFVSDETLSTPSPNNTLTAISPPPMSPPMPSSHLTTGLSFLARPPLPTSSPFASQTPSSSAQTQVIPPAYHIPPHPLPPQPPILLVPFTSHLGFRQVPMMLYDFFTERFRVRSGAEAALALIESKTREMEGPPSSRSDLEFDNKAERWYKKSFKEVPSRTEKARKDYYATLEPKIHDIRDLDEGKRQLTDAEQKSTKPLATEVDLRAERQKKELRWQGTEEGYEIVKPETPVAWDDSFEGWLQVFETPTSSYSAFTS